MNKKYFGIIGIIVLLIVLMICITLDPNKKEHKLTNDPEIIMQNAQEESEEFKNSKEQKSFTEINMDTYLEYYSGSEKKIILIARPTCHYCQIAEPIISKLAYEYDLEINYLNTDNFQEGDVNKLIASNEMFSEGFGTPLLLIVKDNNIQDSKNGLTDYAHYKKIFKDNKFIK